MLETEPGRPDSKICYLFYYIRPRLEAKLCWALCSGLRSEGLSVEGEGDHLQYGFYV